MTINHCFIVLSIFLNPCSSLFAATPATHVFFAERYIKCCKPGYTQKEHDAFIRGTLFPDIRYLAHIPRNKTHTNKLKLDDIVKQKNPFIAGKLFHSFVDEQRQRVVRKEKIHSVLLAHVPEKIGHQLLKVVEDELCYHAIERSSTLNALKTYDETEKNRVCHFIPSKHGIDI